MTSEFPDGIKWTDVIMMDDWIGLNGGLFFNVEKAYRGKKIILTMKLDEGEVEPTVIGSNDPKRLNTERFRFVPPETQPSLDVLNIKTSFKQAFEQLMEQYKRFLYLLEPEYYELLALGAMSTYFREVFYSYPYFDFYAREFNCGKTTAMKCLIWSSFYGFLPLDPTGAVLFRAIDSCHSAVGIDELDNVIQDEKGRSNIIGLLNAAYQKGTPAYRIDMEKGGEVVPYDPFGLKSFTHTAPLPDSFTSRSIIIIMYRTPEAKKQLRTPDSFKTFRDMMYSLRLNMVSDVDTAYNYVLENCDLLNRGRDRFAPLLTMAYLIDQNLYERILAWAQEYIKNESPASFDEVDRSLIELLRDQGKSRVLLSELRNNWNKLLQERELATKDYGSRKLSKKLESFGFSKSEYRAGNRVYYEISPKRLMEWVRIYNISESCQTTLEPKSVVVDQDKIGNLDKYLVDNKSGASFEPCTLDKENTNSIFWRAVEAGLVEEEKAGGPYRLTNKARERLKEVGY
ncbi:MAG: hypothetical protein ACTSPB_09960 [Candidatus Thorarchaeota archaeon]